VIGLHTGDIREVQLPHESNTHLDRPR